MLDVGIPGLGKFPRLNPRTLQCLIVYLAIFSHGGALGRDIPDARSPRSLLALEDSGIFLSSSCGPPGSLLQVSGVPPSGPECPLLRCTYQWEDAGQGGTSMRTAVVDGELLAAPAGANSTCDFLCHLPDASVLGSGYGSLLIHVTVQLANSDASLELDFTITEWVTQTFITPAYGPLGNPTLVEISSALEGVPFPEACGVAAIICRFGEVMAHGTYDEASGRLTCTAPSQVATDILLAQDTAALADASAAGITAAMRAEHGGAAFRHYPVLLSLSFDDGLSFTTLGVYLYYEPPLVLLWRGAPWLGAAVAPEGELLNDPSNWRPIKVPSSEDVAVLAPPADTLPLLALVTSSMSLRQLILASRCSHLLCADSDTATIAPSVHPVTLRLSSELALGTGGLKVGYGGHVELAGPAAVLNLTHATSGATVGGGGLMTWRAGTLASGTGGGDPASVNVTALASLRLDPAGMLWLAHGLALWVHGTMDVPPAPQVAWMAGEGLLGVAPAGKVQVAGSLLRLSVPLVLQPGSSLRVQPAGVTNATRAASRETSTKSKEMSKNEAQREIPGGDGKEIEETPGGDGKGNPAGIGKATSGGDGRQTEPMVVGGEGEAVDERTDWSFSPAGTRHRTRRSLLLLRGGGGGSGEDDSQHPSGHLRPTGLFTLARRSLVAAMGGHSPVVTSPWPRTAPPPVAEGPTGGNPMVGSTQVMSRGIDPSQVVESMTMESSQTGASDQQGRPAPSTLKLASVPKLARAREGQPVKSQHRDAHGNLPGVPHQTPHQTDILEVGSHMGRGLRKDLPSRSLAHGAQRRRLAAETASGTFASVIATSGNLSNAAAALVLDAAGSSLLEGDVYAGARCVVVLGGRGPVSLMRNQTVEGPGLLLLRSEAAAGFVFEGSVRVDHLWLDASAFRNSSEESAEPPRPLASFHQPSLSLVSLQITGGSLVSAGKSLETVHVSSLFGWSGGWIQDVSSLVLSGQALVLGGEDKVISGIRGTLMTITNGTLAWNSTGRLVGNATQIILGPGGAALFARGANLGIQHVRVDAGGLIQIPAPNGTDLNGVPLLVSTTPFIVHISGNLTLAERAALVMSPGWRLQVDGHMSLMSPLTVRVRNESALVAGRSFPILQAVNGASFGPVGLRVESGMDCDPPRRTAFLTTYDAPTGTVTLTTSQDIHEACCRPGFYSIPNNTTSVTPSPATAPPPTSMPAPPPPASAMPPGDVGCLPCPAGTAGKIVGGRREDCVDCGIGAFSSVSGSTACTACPTGTYTLTVTATAAVECRECSLLLSDTSALAGLPLDFTTQLVAHCAIGPPAAPPPPPPPPADSSFWHLRDDNGKWNWELIIAVAVASGGGLLVLLVPLLLCCCHMRAKKKKKKKAKKGEEGGVEDEKEQERKGGGEEKKDKGKKKKKKGKKNDKGDKDGGDGGSGGGEGGGKGLGPDGNLEQGKGGGKEDKDGEDKDKKRADEKETDKGGKKKDKKKDKKKGKDDSKEGNDKQKDVDKGKGKRKKRKGKGSSGSDNSSSDSGSHSGSSGAHTLGSGSDAESKDNSHRDDSPPAPSAPFPPPDSSLAHFPDPATPIADHDWIWERDRLMTYGPGGYPMSHYSPGGYPTSHYTPGGYPLGNYTPGGYPMGHYPPLPVPPHLLDISRSYMASPGMVWVSPGPVSGYLEHPGRMRLPPLQTSASPSRSFGPPLYASAGIPGALSSPRTPQQQQQGRRSHPQQHGHGRSPLVDASSGQSERVGSRPYVVSGIGGAQMLSPITVTSSPMQESPEYRRLLYEQEQYLSRTGRGSHAKLGY